MFGKNLKTLIYLFILLIPFFIFFVRFESFSEIKFKFVKVTSAPLRILSFPLKEVKKILYYHRTFDEYKRLRKETDVLRARLTGMEEVILENTRMEQLLDFKRKLIYSSVAANVIGRDPSFWNSSMIIDKGKADGMQLGMPVVNAFGVVGKISEVSEVMSKVILLTDPQFSVSGLVQRPRESGLVTGTLSGLCRLRFVDPEADIRVGDLVVTSKLSSSFPESLVIGEIIKRDESPHKPTKEYILQPAVSFSQIEEVLVILNQPKGI